MKAPIEIINTRNQGIEYTRTGDSVALSVYPRIHMFPVDLSLISGVMKNGSLGCSLKDMPIEIVVRKSDSSQDVVHVEGGVDVKNLDLKMDLDVLRTYIASDDHYDVTISARTTTREHTGLGMSTQVLGGIYVCCAKASGKDLKINDLYKIGLGHHSALGLNLLFNPGMVIDMGTAITKDKDGVIANPTISQQRETIVNTVYKVNQFPFYTIIAIPKQKSSVTNELGDSYFNDTLPNKNDDSYQIVYDIFETLIPGIIEADFGLFVSAFNEIISLGIKQYEEKFQDDRTKEVLAHMRHTFDFASVSSLGPTLFAFSDKDPADHLAELDAEDYDFAVYKPTGEPKKKIGDGETLLIAAFAAMGKTTFSKDHPDIALDIESIHYARIYTDQHPDDEIAKGDTNWTDNPDYPANYVKDVLKNMGKYKVIFLTLAQSVLGELDKQGIKYTILYPGPNRKQQILADSKKRGNDDDFVAFLDKLLSSPDHREEFEAFQHESFEILDDGTYMEEYIKDNYDLS